MHQSTGQMGVTRVRSSGGRRAGVAIRFHLDGNTFKKAENGVVFIRPHTKALGALTGRVN